MYPAFKFEWLSESQRINAEKTIKLLLIDVEAVGLDERGQSFKTEEVSNNDKTKSFFMFKREKKKTSKVGSEELRAFIELSDEKVLMLNAFPTLKRLFIRFNTTIPSSASCERLFSVVGIILNSRRGRLNLKTLEQLLMLKSNK